MGQEERRFWIGTHHGKLGIQGWVHAEFELRGVCAAGCAWYSAGDGGGELVWDAAVAG